MSINIISFSLIFFNLWIVLTIISCSVIDENQIPPSSITKNSMNLKGTVEVDGSSTLAPLSEAVAEEFKKIYSKANVLVGISGTGGGFKRFVIGEIDISDASRAIKDREINQANENGIDYAELRIGLSCRRKILARLFRNGAKPPETRCERHVPDHHRPTSSVGGLSEGC